MLADSYFAQHPASFVLLWLAVGTVLLIWGLVSVARKQKKSPRPRS